MPHAALWVVQRTINDLKVPGQGMFQCRTRLCGWCNNMIKLGTVCLSGFNAARGFVGGATTARVRAAGWAGSFNAARGFVGGATASLAALVPLWGKSPFGKSPEI